MSIVIKKHVRWPWLILKSALFTALFIALTRDFLRFYPVGTKLLAELLSNFVAGALIGGYFLKRAIQTHSLSQPKGLLNAALAWAVLFVVIFRRRLHQLLEVDNTTSARAKTSRLSAS